MKKQLKLIGDYLYWKWEHKEQWASCECPSKTKLQGETEPHCRADCVSFCIDTVGSSTLFSCYSSDLCMQVEVSDAK